MYEVLHSDFVKSGHNGASQFLGPNDEAEGNTNCRIFSLAMVSNLITLKKKKKREKDF